MLARLTAQLTPSARATLRHPAPVSPQFFDATDEQSDHGVVLAQSSSAPQPGRISKDSSAVSFQDEREYAPMCADRARNGYNSGMGEIFRKVASVRNRPRQLRSLSSHDRTAAASYLAIGLPSRPAAAGRSAAASPSATLLAPARVRLLRRPHRRVLTVHSRRACRQISPVVISASLPSPDGTPHSAPEASNAPPEACEAPSAEAATPSSTAT